MPINPSKADPAELVVLSLLADEPLYGYLITKKAAARSEGAFNLTPGVLYPLLKRLERQGLVTSSWEEIRSERAEEDATGRRRKWYRLSAKGRKRLEASIQAHREYQRALNAFLGPEGAA